MHFNDLYQEIILDHSRNPRNKSDLSHLPGDRVYDNPSCGDTVIVDIVPGEDGRIARVVFDGSGCAISVSSASMMSEYLPGKTPAEALAGIEDYIRYMRGESEDLPEDLLPLSGIRKFPMRIKCATLAWHAIKDLLQNAPGIVH